MARIRILPPHIANQIAAGEVIERPSSIIKELIENSIDSGADHIEVTIHNGGKTFISIKDNGAGIEQNDLPLCLLHHSTSKLTNDNLVDIVTLGFRGEALSSIASVSKIQIASKPKNQTIGYSISAQNNKIAEIEPHSISHGTLVTVKDLFFSVPARLKFLKSDASEAIQCYKIFKRLVAANPLINFKLFNNNKLVFNFPSFQDTLSEQDPIQSMIYNRAAQIFGSQYSKNSFYITHQDEKISIIGIFSIPTYHKNNQDEQYIIINGRSLKDRTLSSIVKFAYSDVIPYGKHPCYILYININNEEIDVNVSPTKSEVRFRDTSFVRYVILNVIKHHLKKLTKTNSEIATTLLDQSCNVSLKQNQLQSYPAHKHHNFRNKTLYNNNNHFDKQSSSTFIEEHIENLNSNIVTPTRSHNDLEIKNDNPQYHNELQTYPLGFAKAQLHLNWIIAQNDQGIIIVDQHAAHERISHEKIFQQYKNNDIVIQILIIPAVINVDQEQIEIARVNQSYIAKLGIEFDIIGSTSIAINSYPAILKHPNIAEMFLDLLSDLTAIQTEEQFNKHIHSIISSLACHSSIRSGTQLSISEMNNLLRDMEQTENFTQCSHGRPTFIELNIKNIEKLFGRT